eukprot:CAMPEP_0185726980 /NCGR_PEP_ID=MMETSP1171-20130828/2792_1 /TAXON_ID=374046 /ORGANISM="Helicotheca tamensis, Strain CCMP826" /LENGTH=431 /DNA_ID=CAMNT_0028395433 /DNA_START=142 /DNA_END=1437 /DNA_ORIENTATION=-
MSLLDALRAGGFEFPDLENGGGDDKVLDADSVQLCQRKNQLSRRLRLARRQAAQAAGNGSGGKEKKIQKNVGGADTGTQQQKATKGQSKPNPALDEDSKARMQILMRHSHLSEEQARRFIGKSGADNIGGPASGVEGAAASNKRKAIQEAAQALLEEEATHRDQVEPFLKRKASGKSGEETIDYSATDREINAKENDMDLAAGRHNRIAKNHPLFAAQQQALFAQQRLGQVPMAAAVAPGKGGQEGNNGRVWGGNNTQQSTNAINASQAEAAAALPAAVASLQRLTGNGAGLFPGLNLPGGPGALGAFGGTNDTSGFGAQQMPTPGTFLLGGGPAPFGPMIGGGPGAAAHLQPQVPDNSNKPPTSNLIAGIGLEPKPEQKNTSDSASVASSASSHLAKQAESLGLSREQLQSVLLSGGINKSILDGVFRGH